MSEPQLHFHSSEPAQWVGMSVQELYQQMDLLRQKLKQATDYRRKGTK